MHGQQKSKSVKINNRQRILFELDTGQTKRVVEVQKSQLDELAGVIF